MLMVTLADVLWVLGGVAVTSAVLVAVVSWAWSETRAGQSPAAPPSPYTKPPAGSAPTDDDPPAA